MRLFEALTPTQIVLLGAALLLVAYMLYPH